MSPLPVVNATVTFLLSEDGGRQRAPFDDSRYRPHLVIGDSHQRQAIVDEHGVSCETYLGICFGGSGCELTLGVPHTVKLVLLYYPNVDYSALAAGVTFTVGEGGQVVGFGQIMAGT